MGLAVEAAPPRKAVEVHPEAVIEPRRLRGDTVEHPLQVGLRRFRLAQREDDLRPFGDSIGDRYDTGLRVERHDVANQVLIILWRETDETVAMFVPTSPREKICVGEIQSRLAARGEKP